MVRYLVAIQEMQVRFLSSAPLTQQQNAKLVDGNKWS